MAGHMSRFLGTHMAWSSQGQHLRQSPLSPWDGATPVPTHSSLIAVKLGAIFPEHLVRLSSPCSQAPMSSHLGPTHPARGGVGGRVMGWFKRKSRKKALKCFKLEDSTNLDTNLKKTLKPSPSPKGTREKIRWGKKCPPGAEDSRPSGQGVEDTGPHCRPG